jgi:FkbM family methyltransferase
MIRQVIFRLRDWWRLADNVAALRREVEALRRECRLVVPVGGDTVLVRFEDFILGLPVRDGNLVASYTFQDNIELGFRGLFRQHLRAGMTVVDIGAHVGIYTLLAARAVGENGRVLSFEPSPDTFPFLRANVERTAWAGRVTLHPAAVSDQHGGSASFRLASESGRNSSLFFDPATPAPERVEVPLVSLDGLLAPGTRVDLVKIDAEGAELAALRGMTRVLDDNPGLVLFLEYAPEHLRRAGDAPEALLDFLEARGFRLHRIEDFQPAAPAISRADLLRLPAANLLLRRASAPPA